MHDLTDSVIRDRKAEHKWDKIIFYTKRINDIDIKFREMEGRSKQTNFDDNLVGKKRLAFLGMLKQYFIEVDQHQVLHIYSRHTFRGLRKKLSKWWVPESWGWYLHVWGPWHNCQCNVLCYLSPGKISRGAGKDHAGAGWDLWIQHRLKLPQKLFGK